MSTPDPRVLFAAERTLLAWNRTSLALIGFGFVIERSGLLVTVLTPEKAGGTGLRLLFWAGVILIALGTLSALYSSRQYVNVLHSLDPSDVPKGYVPKWGMYINVGVALIGLLLMLALSIGQS